MFAYYLRCERWPRLSNWCDELCRESEEGELRKALSPQRGRDDREKENVNELLYPRHDPNTEYAIRGYSSHKRENQDTRRVKTYYTR
jgi:hypothetical protein